MSTPVPTAVDIPMPPQKKPKDSDPRSTIFGGSVFAEKVDKVLDSLLKTYEARLKKNQTQEQRWMTYPYAELEKERLHMCTQLICTTQAMMEPPIQPNIPRIVLQPFQETPKIGLKRKIEETPIEKPRQGREETNPEPTKEKPLEVRFAPNTTNDSKKGETHFKGDDARQDDEVD